MSVHAEVDFVAGEFWAGDPDTTLTWLRTNDPVHLHEPTGMWGITKHDDIRRVETDQEAFTATKGILPGDTGVPMMATMDDPAHMARRRLMSTGFTPKRVQDQAPRIRAVCDQLIDNVIEDGRCDFVWDIAAWLPLTLIGDLLGFESADHPKLLEWSDDMLMGLGTDDPALAEKQMVSGAAFMGYLQGVIEDRQKRARDDLISILVNAEIDGARLADDELVAEAALLLIGGDETTRHVMTGGLYQLLTHPEQWQALRDDRSLLPGAVVEMLRWVSPVKMVARTTTHQVTLRDKTIPTDTKVLLLYSSANSDEDVFEDPFAFDIHRSPNNHIAFGFGTHVCLGKALARLELSIMFERLLDRLPDVELVNPSPPRSRASNFISGYDDTMTVRFTPGKKTGR
ncbi:MAG: cytochrome P450 [Acidimicrobiales bacterium]